MDQQQPSRTVQRRVLALLLLAYVFNFLDRQILGILAGSRLTPISSLTDAELGRSAVSLSRSALFGAWRPAGTAGRPRAAEPRLSPARSRCGAASPHCAGQGQQLWAIVLLPAGRRRRRGRRRRPCLCADRRLFPARPPGARACRFLAWNSARLGGRPLIGAYLAAWIDWRAAFTDLGVAGLILAPVMLIFVRTCRVPGRPPETDRAPRASSRSSPESQASG